MAILDERLIKFDIDSIKDILKEAPFAALAVGLPSADPSNIVLNPAASTATFQFAGIAVTLGFEKLGAVLVAHCIRAGIKIPRRGARRVFIEAKTVTLAFIREYVVKPLPQSATGDQVAADKNASVGP